MINFQDFLLESVNSFSILPPVVRKVAANFLHIGPNSEIVQVDDPNKIVNYILNSTSEHVYVIIEKDSTHVDVILAGQHGPSEIFYCENGAILHSERFYAVSLGSIIRGYRKFKKIWVVLSVDHERVEKRTKRLDMHNANKEAEARLKGLSPSNFQVLLDVKRNDALDQFKKNISNMRINDLNKLSNYVQAFINETRNADMNANILFSRERNASVAEINNAIKKYENARDIDPNKTWG